MENTEKETYVKPEFQVIDIDFEAPLLVDSGKPKPYDKSLG